MTITARPMTMFHELESAYVLGDFSLESTDKGFVIVPPKPFAPPRGTRRGHSIDPDGTMWLSGGIGFRPGSADGDPWVTFDLGSKRDFDRIAGLELQRGQPDEAGREGDGDICFPDRKGRLLHVDREVPGSTRRRADRRDRRKNRGFRSCLTPKQRVSDSFNSRFSRITTGFATRPRMPVSTTRSSD